MSNGNGEDFPDGPIEDPGQGKDEAGRMDPSGRDLSSSATTPSTSSATEGNDDAADASGFVVGGDGAADGGGAERSYTTVNAKEDDAYDLSEGVRLAVVLNHENFQLGDLPVRNGTEQDARRIEDAFTAMGFQVLIYDDHSFDQIQALIKMIQHNQVELSCLALFVLTHGKENGVLYATDKPYRLDRHIIEELTPANCPSLAGKPKLLFIQACQGEETDAGSKVHTRTRHTSHDGNGSGSYRIPHYADFLIFQAAYQGHYSFRSRSGSWFIQALCRCLEESDPKQELHGVLVKAKRLVATEKLSNVPSQPHLDGKVQIPLAQDTLIREVYLKLGIPGSEGVSDAAQSLADLSLPPADSRDNQSPSKKAKKSGDKCSIM